MSGGVRGAAGGGARPSALLPGGGAVAESNRGAGGNGRTGRAWGGGANGVPRGAGPRRALRPRQRCQQVAGQREGGEAPRCGRPALLPPGEVGPGAAEGPRGPTGRAGAGAGGRPSLLGALLSPTLCRSSRSPFSFLVEVLCSFSREVSFSERRGALNAEAVPSQKLALHFNALLPPEVKVLAVPMVPPVSERARACLCGAVGSGSVYGSGVAWTSVIAGTVGIRAVKKSKKSMCFSKVKMKGSSLATLTAVVS